MTKWISVKDKPAPKDRQILGWDGNTAYAIEYNKSSKLYDYCNCYNDGCLYENEIMYWTEINPPENEL